MSYTDFLKSKVVVAPKSGFEFAQSELNPALKGHQKDAVQWALSGGRRALFESFGLGKTAQEIEFCHQAVCHERANGNPQAKALIVLPLGVKQEFSRDATALLHYEAPPYVRTQAEADAYDGEKVAAARRITAADGRHCEKIRPARRADRRKDVSGHGR